MSDTSATAGIPPETAQASVEPPPDAAAERPVVFFDGLCGLCDGSVSFLLKIDRRGRLRFAPLQGEAAQTLPEEYVRDLDSIAFRDARGLSRKSTAVGRILKTIGGVWAGLGALLLLLPRPLRDFGYDVVAKNRYRVWGKREACRMPSPEERERFLD